MAARDTKPRGRRRGLEHLALFAVLFAFWLVLSDHFDPKSLAIGAACCALVLAISEDRVLRVGGVPSDFGLPIGRVSPLRMLRYALWLLREIVDANIHVARIVLHPRMPIEPKLLRFRAGFDGEIPQVVLAHSITLTPGTVTIDLRDGSYLVHALVPRSASALQEGRMQRRVAAAFGMERAGTPAALEWLESVHETGEVREREDRS